MKQTFLKPERFLSLNFTRPSETAESGPLASMRGVLSDSETKYVDGLSLCSLKKIESKKFRGFEWTAFALSALLSGQESLDNVK